MPAAARVAHVEPRRQIGTPDGDARQDRFVEIRPRAIDEQKAAAVLELFQRLDLGGARRARGVVENSQRILNEDRH